MENDEDSIARRLKSLRKSRGLTVSGLADKMKEDHQKVGRIERGARAITVDYLVKVSKALQTPIESLVQEEKKAEGSKENFALLSEIIRLCDLLNFSFSDPKQKGNLITKIYELTLSFPQNTQDQALKAMFDLLKAIGNRSG